jgi:hypothetical protein
MSGWATRTRLVLVALLVALTYVGVSASVAHAESNTTGFWLAAADGGVFTFGGAGFFGSVPGLLQPGVRLNAPVVGMASTPTLQGYWLVAADGGVFAFGDAQFYGSAAEIRLNAPIVGLVPSPRGYWLIGADGGVFSFGDAIYAGNFTIEACGDTPSCRESLPVVSALGGSYGYYAAVSRDGLVTDFATGLPGYARLQMPPKACPTNGCAVAATKSGSGYLVLGQNPQSLTAMVVPVGNTAGVDAAKVREPAPVGIAVAGDGGWIAGAGGTVHSFGGAPFLGDLADVRLNAPLVAIASHPQLIYL